MDDLLEKAVRHSRMIDFTGVVDTDRNGEVVAMLSHKDLWGDTLRPTSERFFEQSSREYRERIDRGGLPDELVSAHLHVIDVFDRARLAIQTEKRNRGIEPDTPDVELGVLSNPDTVPKFFNYYSSANDSEFTP